MTEAGNTSSIGAHNAVGARAAPESKMQDDPMTKEAWSLAAALLSKDGLNTPALLLWRDADDAVKLGRVESKEAGGNYAADLVACAGGFAFDHCILISRTLLGLAAPEGHELQAQRHGVSLNYVSRAGDRYTQFAELFDIDGVVQLSLPTTIPSMGNALDVLISAQLSSH